MVLEVGDRLLIGRGRLVSIRVPDAQISRRHALIIMRADGLFVRDVGSRNGTTLSHKPVLAHRLVPMTVGDLLEAGARFSLEVLELQTEVEVSSELPPSILREFEILGRIGEGSNGHVFAALRRGRRQPVALKVVHGKGTLLEARAEIRAEAELLERARCPHVIALHEARPEADPPFMVQELLTGGSLADLVVRGPLHVAEVLSAGAQVARALEAIHARDVVHLDVKPSNLLLTPQGDVKLADFGSAQDLRSTRPTPGEGIGSLHFASPEQLWDAGSAGPAADLYGLGATLHTLLTGRLPRPSQAAVRLLAAPEPAVRPLRDARPDCPPKLCTLIEGLLQEEPADRPSSAQYVAGCLTALSEQVAREPETEPESPTGDRKTHKLSG